jgi:hypothetical protein
MFPLFDFYATMIILWEKIKIIMIIPWSFVDNLRK